MYTVLLADNEESVLHILKRSIDWQELGVDTLLTASDGQEALALFERQRIDLLVSDIRMPGMSGIELIRRVRRLQPDLHCVLLTAYGEFEYAREAILLGVDNYLLKLLGRMASRDDSIRWIAVFHPDRETNYWYLAEENRLERLPEDFAYLEKIAEKEKPLEIYGGQWEESGEREIVLAGRFLPRAGSCLCRRSCPSPGQTGFSGWTESATTPRSLRRRPRIPECFIWSGTGICS